MIFEREMFSPPPYNSDLAPSDHQLSPTVKTCPTIQCFENEVKLLADVNEWLKNQMQNFTELELLKLYAIRINVSV